ncbi:aldehyde dehydrogenase family protein [Nocardia sp. NPDC020380]|uniref:aldehyde dehydrogenase family protein n=1 Tax=Nocardia sp. NPDC020380 TaxID=3364309 RepID=UPI0037B7D026
METTHMTIGGRVAAVVDTFPVENPADAEVFAAAPAATVEQVDAAVTAARTAHPRWAALPIDGRRAHLRKCGAALSAAADEIAALLTREQGKPLVKARAEVELSATWFSDTAGQDLAVEDLGDAGAEIRLQHKPYGVVAAITPWNYPIILAVCKLAPALLAGNTVVLKPSPETPLSSLLMTEVLCEVLPSGVLNVVSGAGPVGRALVEHAGVDKVSFTGSVQTGLAIAASTAQRLQRPTLELGGNDAAIVLPDAPVAEIAERLFWAAFENSGQYCTAVKRVYAHRVVYSDLVDALRAQAEQVVVGDGMDPTTQLGPLVSAHQLDRVAALVEQAVAGGGQVVAGGRRLDRPGHFYAPTIVAGAEPDSRLVQEEQFGPVLPILPFDTVEEAVTQANSTTFGLGGSAWGESDRATEVAAELECGTAWINTHGDLRHGVPFGGYRQSGAGVEYGTLGLLEYTRPRVTHVRRV